MVHETDRRIRMTTVTFRIEGLRSAGCADMMKALLSAEPGVYAVDVSLEPPEARVLFDASTTDSRRLVALIETPGCRVTGRVP